MINLGDSFAIRFVRAGFAPLWIAASLFASTAIAAPVERNIGNGLVYFRAHILPADLPTDQALRKRACVLDLRYAKSDAAGAAVLGGWLKFHSAPRTPIFVLLNGGTAPTLANALREEDALPGLLTVGISAQAFDPDIVVSASPQDERRAYDALETGSTIAALTTDNPDKQRNDEASLARDRAPEPPVDGDDVAESEKTTPKARVLIDATLQRAIQVYRGLQAMKTVEEPNGK